METEIVDERPDVTVFAARFALTADEDFTPTSSVKMESDDTGTYRKDTEDADT